MSDLQYYFANEAKRLHRQLTSDHPAGALTRIRRAIARTRTMPDADIIQSFRHSNALEVIAYEQSGLAWRDFASEPEVGASLDASTLFRWVFVGSDGEVADEGLVLASDHAEAVAYAESVIADGPAAEVDGDQIRVRPVTVDRAPGAGDPNGKSASAAISSSAVGSASGPAPKSITLHVDVSGERGFRGKRLRHFLVADVSTGHLTEADLKRLPEYGDELSLPVIAVTNYGWILYVSHEADAKEHERRYAEEHDLSPMFLGLFDAARADGAHYLWLDADGADYDHLPWHDENRKALHCYECGSPMVIHRDGTSQHLTEGGDYDYDADAHHVPVAEELMD